MSEDIHESISLPLPCSYLLSTGRRKSIGYNCAFIKRCIKIEMCFAWSSKGRWGGLAISFLGLGPLEVCLQGSLSFLYNSRGPCYEIRLLEASEWESPCLYISNQHSAICWTPLNSAAAVCYIFWIETEYCIVNFMVVNEWVSICWRR